MSTDKQIFQTNSPKRWNFFKWFGRIIVYGLLLLIPVIIIAFYQKNPKLPKLFVSKKDGIIKKLELAEEQQQIKIKSNGDANKVFHKNKFADVVNSSNKIRAAFYVNWDESARESLVKHIGNVNMVIPQWFFIDPTEDTLVTIIDEIGLEIMHRFPVKIVPMLSNLNKNGKSEFWDSKLLHGVLKDVSKRQRLIQSISNMLTKYKMDGINIDFEEYDANTLPFIIQFQKELQETLHASNKIVTQDVLPLAQSADAISLATHNDFLFMMGYNEHWSGSKAGNICEQRWIEKVLDDIIEKVPAQKLVLCLAGFGYDWKENTEGLPVKYAEAITLAANNKAEIIFDNDTYSSHFNYSDEANNKHEVFFVDAGGTFNAMRLSDELNLAGTALWRLGSEDERIWKFYSKDLSNAGLAKSAMNFKDLEEVGFVQNTPCYVGQGEVLDVQSYPQSGLINLEIDSVDQLISEQKYLKLPTQYVIKKWGVVNNQVVLTFDDGPDEKYTPQILDILEKEKVPATFFITGANAQENIPIIKRINKNGFEIGNHTFSHPNISKVSTARTLLELKSTRLLIEAITGRSTVLFRAPYNADSEPTSVAEIIPIAESKKQNYYTIGESIDSRDWDENTTADSIYNRVVTQYELDKKKGIVLLHDAGGNREATVLALPRIIQYFKKNGVQITTVANILGKSKNEIMPIVNKQSATVNGFLALSVFYAQKCISFIFQLAMLLGIFRIGLILIFAIIQKIKFRKEKLIIAKNKVQPAVSVIVPAFNEKVTIKKTIENLLQMQYSNFEIIFVDDGSTDNTLEIVQQNFGNNNLVKCYTKQNGGKASALNFGIAKTKNEFVVCIDGDTILLPNAITEMMQFFNSEKVGAVAGNVKVGNQRNMLTIWQSIEYICAQNIDRRAFDYINAIAIVPGAIGAFRKAAIQQAGGFTNDTLAEDCDVTIRINKCGYVIRNCNTAIAMTEAPETIDGLLKQRFRWNYGVMQSFWKNRKACFNPKYKGLGLFGLPNILLFQIILPLISPLADFLFIVSLFWQNNNLNSSNGLVTSYVFLLIIDMVFSAIAFYFDGESFKKLIYIIPQRIFYKPLMYIVIIKSVRKALKGESQKWGTLERTGNVKDIVVSGS